MEIRHDNRFLRWSLLIFLERRRWLRGRVLWGPPRWEVSHRELCRDRRRRSSALQVEQAAHRHEVKHRGRASGTLWLGQPGTIYPYFSYCTGVSYAGHDDPTGQPVLHGAHSEVRSGAERTRHIQIRNFWVKERVDKGEVKIEYLRLEDMYANVLTKPLQGAQFVRERGCLTGWAPETASEWGRSKKIQLSLDLLLCKSIHLDILCLKIKCVLHEQLLRACWVCWSIREKTLQQLCVCVCVCVCVDPDGQRRIPSG